MSSVDKQERNFIEAFRREYVAVDENRNLKHHGTEQIALAAFRAWKASAPSSCAATVPVVALWREYRAALLRTNAEQSAAYDRLCEELDRMADAPLPESGPIQAHSKTEYKRLKAQGVDVAPPSASAEPVTPGSWAERCATLYQVIGLLADYAGVFETSDDVMAALDVASGRGDVEGLLPWPKDATLGKSSAFSSSTSITDPLLPGLLEAERILRMIGYDEEDFAMQRLLAHIAPRRVTADQMAAMSAVSATEGSKP